MEKTMAPRLIAIAALFMFTLAGCATTTPLQVRQPTQHAAQPTQQAQPSSGSMRMDSGRAGVPSTYVEILAEMRAIGCEVQAFELSENVRQMDLKIGCK